jgi:hypothetical protein
MTIQAIDLAISFDTTGSMYPCLTQVRRNVANLVKKMIATVQGIRIAIIAHGDYCDEGHSYVTKILDFTSDEKKISDFIQGVEPTGGGDAPECYELVLHQARSLSWKSGKSKVLVMIGDDVPHAPNYPLNKGRIDWRNELGLLTEAGISVHGVHALPGCRRHSKSFYDEIARKTGGFYLTLDQFSTVEDLLMAVATKQDGDETLNSYVETVKAAGRATRNFINIVGTLTGKAIAWAGPKVTTSDGKELVPVPTGRFQVMKVDETTVIANFVQAQGASFKPGRGFYELTKSEKVQGYKEIILQDKVSGDLFNGSQVRDLLGLPHHEDGRLSSKSLLDKYRIFVQSTSYNRKLVGDTYFLYETPDWERLDDAA